MKVREQLTARETVECFEAKGISGVMDGHEKSEAGKR